MPLQLLRQKEIFYGSEKRYVSLYKGDLSELSSSDGVDYLCVSAQPNKYDRYDSSLIAALAKKGIYIDEMFNKMLADFRSSTKCWITQDVSNANFKRILVFEPNDISRAEEYITYIFSTIKYVEEENMSPICVALPLVCTGYGGADKNDIFEEIFYQAAHWCAMKFPFKEIKIVLYNSTEQDIAKFDSMVNEYDGIKTLKLDKYYPFYANQASKLAEANVTNDTLTDRQKYAIHLYTTNYYSVLNSVLRDLKGSHKGAEYKKYRPIIEALNSGLMNLPYYTNKTYRGVNLTKEQQNEYSVGKTDVNWAYTSSSYKKSAAFTRNTFITFQSYLGVCIESYSQYPSEREVLFAEHMDFITQNTAPLENKIHFYCAEIAPLFRR